MQDPYELIRKWADALEETAEYQGDHALPVVAEMREALAEAHEGVKESAQCPYCGETFYAPPLHDPLRKHVDYCGKRPVLPAVPDLPPETEAAMEDVCPTCKYTFRDCNETGCSGYRARGWRGWPVINR